MIQFIHANKADSGVCFICKTCSFHHHSRNNDALAKSNHVLLYQTLLLTEHMQALQQSLMSTGKLLSAKKQREVFVFLIIMFNEREPSYTTSLSLVYA